jgi:hypothetical protein
VLQFRRVLREDWSRVRLFLSHSGTFCSALFLADDRAPWVKQDRSEERADLRHADQLL